MIGPSFVDANVFIYTRDARDVRKRERAIQWIDVLWRDRIGRTSIQAISEFYAVATRKLGIPAERAWMQAERYLAWNPCPVDEALLRRAREVELRYKLSWWDSMIVGAAQLQDCVLLLTEDLQDGAAYGAVTVRSP
ncbi:MAG TPA: PIN domain-containing protein, partial [Burkholderiales bacterium]|nr:PIN domain-containing protein [Burkholderiales bacterium]